MKEEHAFGKSTISEIRSQAETWEHTMRRIDEDSERLKGLFEDAEEVVFTGCGSGCNIAHAVAPYFQQITGKTTRAVHSSDVVLNPDMFIRKKVKTAAVLFSRSGRTTESAMALRKIRSLGCEALSIVCFPESSMGREADQSIVLEEAVEKSVTTTRSLTAMVLAGNYLAAVVSERDDLLREFRKLPGLGKGMMEEFEKKGKEVSENGQIQKYAFLGSGSYYGLAREAQLKIKEMVLLPSDSYISLDYQHGPMSNVDPNMLVCLFVSDTGKGWDISLAKKMKELGGVVMILCDSAAEEFYPFADYIIELGTGLADGIRNILYMPSLQFMAYYKSLAVGNDPDNPKNLSYYVDVGD